MLKLYSPLLSFGKGGITNTLSIFLLCLLRILVLYWYYVWFLGYKYSTSNPFHTFCVSCTTTTTIVCYSLDVDDDDEDEDDDEASLNVLFKRGFLGMCVWVLLMNVQHN